LVLNEKVREVLQVKDDIKGKISTNENLITTLAFLSFLKFFGVALMILAIFFFIETSFSTNLLTLVFMIMGFCFHASGLVWEDKLKRRVKKDVY
jgi:VIT1/CCC1 family predicted Fe2+/Mn2+ transporter